MKWDKYTIATTTAAEDIISAMLSGLGIEGVEIENNVPLTKEETGSMFIDFPPQLPPDDGTSRVSFYLESGQNHEGLIQDVQDALAAMKQEPYVDIGTAQITKGQTEDADWMNNWKQFFQSFTIEDILIKPAWEELKADDTGKILIEIEPGISFGTGKHETTQLCIRQLKKYIQAPESPAVRVFDVGCGSGILSVAALKLGAASVNGIDIDENCAVSAEENMRLNHLDETRWHFYTGNLLEDGQLQRQEAAAPYDIIVANILADVIIPMAPVLQPCLKPGGIFITSGIIDFKEQEVRAALEQVGFAVLETNVQGEWVSITVQKPLQEG